MTTLATKNHFSAQITGDGPLLPMILRLALPVVAMMYLQNAYNIIDTIWVGRLLGEASLAGIGVGGYILWMLFGFAGLVSTGLTAVIARRVGEGETEKAETVAARGLWYATVCSVVIGFSVYILLEPVFKMMGTDMEVTAQGMAYIKLLIIGAPLIFLSFAIQSMFQAAGDTITPMWLMALSLLINTVLDPVLMLGLFGLPEMGIAGAAMSTVIARGAWVALGIWLLARGLRIGQRPHSRMFGLLTRALPQIKPGPLRLPVGRRFDWNWKLFGNVLRIGMPHAFSATLFPFTYMVIVRIPAQFGAHEIAALRVGHTVEGMSFFLALGFMIATSTMVGQNLGAGKPIRARNAALTGVGIVTAVLLVFSICFRVFSHPISAVFSTDAQTIAASAVYLEILAWSQIFMGIEITLSGAFTGAGDTLPPMLTAVPFNLARIPAAFLLSGTFGMGVLGVWWAISGTSIIKGLVLTYWFSRGRWAEKQV